jgi:putative peptide zinc metalloprotease protein
VRRRLLIVLLVLAALAVPAFARADGGEGGANSAVAINTKDNSDLFKFAFAIRHVMGDVVDQQNAAVAFASCTSCQTTAIAIEIVLVEGNPTTVSPQNIAIAENQGCTLCDTFASAYQFVVGTGGPVHFTEQGLMELLQIRKEIESWGKQGLTNEQIAGLLPGVVARIKDVLATQLVPDGNSGAAQGDESSSTTNESARPNAPPGTTATTQSGTVETTTAPTTTTAPATTTGTTTVTTPTTTTAPTTTTTP